MPLISIPSKARDRYLKMCMDCYLCKDPNLFELETERAGAYGEAIKDICGLEVWGHIVMEADLQLPDGVEACCGIPFERKDAK